MEGDMNHGCARLAMILLAAMVIATAAPALAETRFVFANESPYDTLDPHAVFDVGRVAVRLNLYDGLYRWLDNPPVLHPWLAESHTVSADGLTYTFKLRQGVKFHDAAEVAAEDVRYSTERICAGKRGGAALLSTMVAPASTKALDRYTVQFTLGKPAAIFLAVVPEIHVVNSALLKKHEKDGDWGAAWLVSNDAGSGSYMLTRYDPAIGFIARRFAGHFIPWGPRYIDAVEVRDVKGYTYDLEKAKQELAKAETKVDRPLSVGYLTGFSQTEQAATVMANGLRKIGIDTKIVSELWPAMVERMKKPETSPDLVVYWISTYYADPNNWIGEMFHSGPGWCLPRACGLVPPPGGCPRGRPPPIRWRWWPGRLPRRRRWRRSGGSSASTVRSPCSSSLLSLASRAETWERASTPCVRSRMTWPPASPPLSSSRWWRWSCRWSWGSRSAWSRRSGATRSSITPCGS